jgi:hypothetical protein
MIMPITIIIIILFHGNKRIYVKFIILYFDEISLYPLLARLLFGRVVFKRGNFKLFWR